MSYHIQPDPHPGRCKNCRQGRFDPNTYMNSSRRCLRHDLHEGACRFDPEDEPRVLTHENWTSSKPIVPTPWVEPGSAPRSVTNPQATTEGGAP